jgi:hypothetical protein
MSRKEFPFQSKPYIPPSRFPDNRPVSKEIIKTDDSILGAAMVSVINTNNPSEILNFFQTKLGASYKDKDGNTPIHFLMMIDENKLNQKQKIFIIKQLMLSPVSISIDTVNNQMETPLHMATVRQLNEVIEFLITNGADPNNINANHQNVIHLAMIPNIQPCEKRAGPDPIVNLDASVDEKNTIYNEALSVFYNDRRTIQPAIDIIKFHASNIDKFYEDYKQTDILISDDKVVTKQTQIEKSLKDIQNIFTTNMIKNTNKPSDIKKNINYQTIKSIQKISAEYEKLIGSSLTEINLENRTLLDMSETDIEIICKHLLSDKESISDIEKQLANAKNTIREKIYNQIDSILRTLNSGYTFNRKDIAGELPILAFAPTIVPGANFGATLQTLANSLANTHYIIRNTRQAYENHILGIFNGAVFGPLNDPQENRVKSVIQKLLFLQNINAANNDNQCLNLFIYLYGSHLYSDTPDENIRDKIIQYYNMLLDGIGQYMKTGSVDPTTANPVAPPHNIHNTMAPPALAPGLRFNLNTLDSTMPLHQNVIQTLNNILPGHINTLNLWLALDNIKVRLENNKFYNFVPSLATPNPPMYQSVYTYKLNNFILVPNATNNYSAQSIYGEISDQRGNLLQNAAAAVAPDVPAPGLGAIPIGYNKFPTSQIMDKWGSFNKVVGGAAAAAIPPGQVQQHFNGAVVNPLNPSVQNIYNSLSKLGIFDGAIDNTVAIGGPAPVPITSNQIDTLVQSIFNQIQVAHNAVIVVGAAIVVGNINDLHNNPTPLEISQNAAIRDVIVFNQNILNIIAGQNLQPAIAAGGGAPPAVLNLLNSAKETLIMAVVEGIILDDKPIMTLPREMNKMHRTVFNAAPAVFAGNNGVLGSLANLAALNLIPQLTTSIYNAFDLIGYDPTAPNQANILTALQSVVAAISLDPAGGLVANGQHVQTDQSIQQLINTPQIINALRQGGANPIPAAIFQALNDGVNPPAANSQAETDICKKVLRAVLTGYLTYVPPKTGSSLTQVAIVPNSFGIDNKNSDYMNYIKKRFIMWFVQRLKAENFPPPALVLPNPPNMILQAVPPVAVIPAQPTDLRLIFTQIQTIIQRNFADLEALTPADLKLKTLSLIIKILDRLFINTLKSEVYYLAVNKLKTIILQDNTNPTYSLYRNRIIKFLNQILHKSNVSVKLDKKIDQMILIQNPNLNQAINPNYNMNVQPAHIIDEESITQIFDYGTIDPVTGIRDEPTRIYRKQNSGDYIVHYPKDYTSLQPISVRQCLYNTTSTIKTIFNRSRTLDYFKSDINKFTPIFYAIHSKNHLLIREFIEYIKGPGVPAVAGGVGGIMTYPNYTYQIQSQLNGFNQSPVSYAFNMIREASIVPEFDVLNVTFMNNLLLSGDINRNIPKGYYDMYKYLMWDLGQFFLNPTTHTFRGLINIQPAPPAPRHSYLHDMNNVDRAFVPNTVLDRLIYSCPLLNQIPNPDINQLIQNLDQIIMANKSIQNIMNQIIQDKIQAKTWDWAISNSPIAVPQAATNLQAHLTHLKTIVTILESKYRPNRLYDYVNTDNAEPPNQILEKRPTQLIPRNVAQLKYTNQYFLLLIVMGIISIRDILQTYYLNVILKTLYTSDIYNLDFINQNQIIFDQAKYIIDGYLKANIFDLVRVFYFIKLDQYDNLSQNQSVVEEYFTKLLNELSQNGIVQPESTQYNNIKQYINTHMIEFVSKTLQYNQVVIDIFHRWVVNLYHSLKTYDELTK